MSNNTQVIRLAGCVIRDEQGKILLLHRNTEKWQHWEIPGGKIEAGETAEQAAIREVQEEVGVEVKILGQVGSKVFAENDYRLDYTWYLAGIIKGKPAVVEADTFDKLQFFPTDEMSELTLSTGVQNFLSLVSERGGLI